MNNYMMMEIITAIATACFVLSASLKGWLAYLSWPTERAVRILGTIIHAAFAVSLGALLIKYNGLPASQESFVFIAVLSIFGMWNIFDTLSAITGVWTRRAAHAAFAAKRECK